MCKHQRFGPFLRSVRKQHDVTLNALAKHLNVSVPYISDVESERRGPFSEKNLQLLWPYFGDLGLQLAETARLQRGYVELALEDKESGRQSLGLALAEAWATLSKRDVALIKALLYDLT